MWPGRCWRAEWHSSTVPITARNPGVTRLSHFSQPSGIKPHHHGSDWSHSLPLSPRSQPHSKGQGDRLAAARLMHMDDRRSICSTAECKCPSLFLLLFFCLKGRPCQTLHGISSTCWSQSDDLCKNHNRNASHCCTQSPAQPPTPPQLTLRISCLITFNITENWSQTTSLVCSHCSSLVTYCYPILVCSQSMTRKKSLAWHILNTCNIKWRSSPRSF